MDQGGLRISDIVDNIVGKKQDLLIIILLLYIILYKGHVIEYNTLLLL